MVADGLDAYADAFEVRLVNYVTLVMSLPAPPVPPFLWNCCGAAKLCDTQLATVSRKSTIAEAIRYGLSRWDGLVRFLCDGRIEIDSNVVEHAT